MCKEKEITVLKVSPHKKPEVVTLKNELSALQEAVSSGVKDYHHLIQLVGAEEGVDLLWGRPQQDLAYRGHGGRPLCEAVADGLHQAQCGHSAVPFCRGRGRRDRCADRQNLTAEEKRFPSQWLGNLFASPRDAEDQRRGS